MSFCELNISNFEQTMVDNSIVVVDFWADWCAPCKAFAPIFASVAAEFPTVKFAKVDIQKEEKLSEIFAISSIPFLMIFKEAVVIYAEGGSMPASALRDLVQQAIAVDLKDMQQRQQEDSGE